METPITEPVVQPVSAEPQKPRSSKLLIPLVVLLAVAAYFAFSYTQDLWPFETTTEEAFTTPTPTVQTVVKTYTNAKYGFEFQSPSELKITGEDKQDFSLIMLAKPEGQQLLQIGIRPYSTTFAQIGCGEFAKKQGSIKISGTEVDWCSDTEGHDRWTATYSHTVSGKSTIFDFFCWNPGSNSQICNQILSTFKFTAGADTTGWKTYTNTKYGILIKYPGYNPELSSNIRVELLDNTEPENGPGAFWVKMAQDNWHKMYDKRGSYKIGDECPVSEGEITCKVSSLEPYVLKVEQGWAKPYPHPYKLVFPTANFQLTISFLPSTVSNEEVNQILSTFKFTAGADTTGWKTYTNTEYGFQLTLGDAWKGYKVLRKTKKFGLQEVIVYYLGIPTTDVSYENRYANAFAISAYLLSTWQNMSKDDYERVKNSKLGQNDKYVFSYETWQDVPRDFDGRDLEFHKLASTFKFTK